ncbi:MAG: glycosyltransferase [Nitrospinota bacterium]|nr:MAG: glycosyltransferase [Nitrospinota bacterium]
MPGYSSSKETVVEGSSPKEERSRPLQGIRVLVVTSGHEATDPRIYSKQAVSLQNLGARVTVVGKLEQGIPAEVPVQRVPTPSSRLVRFLYQPWRCLWKVRHAPADIIHFHDAEMLLPLPLARLWWWRSRFVYDVHEDFANLLLVQDWLPAWIKPLVRWGTQTVEKGLAALADAIVGVTPPLTGKFRNRQKITVYNFPSQAFYTQAGQSQRAPREREFDLVHLGTLNKRRALFLAETLHHFHRLRPEARSLVVGVSPEIRMVLQDRLPLQTTLMGKTRYEHIPALLGNARVGLDVHPWLGAHLTVALPVKVCEYMAAGCAVVSSTMPVLQQLLDKVRVDADSILLLAGEEPREYAQAIVRLLKRIEQGEDPGAKLRATALTHLVWEGEVKKLARLYRQLGEK